MQINGYNIEPGTQQDIHLLISRLPSGTKISIKAKVFRSLHPGPTVLVLAGMHGDEINGVEIVRRCIHQEVFTHMQCGSVIAIPILNIYGFMNFSRYLPDGKDVNRSFPGRKSGSLAARVANAVTKHILPIIDFGIDFHTGGDNRYNYPQVRYSPDAPEAYKLAKAFNPPVLLESRTIRKTLRAEAKSKNIPIIVYEGGESLRLSTPAVEIGVQGIKNILATHQMIPSAPTSPLESKSFSKLSWIRAPQAGIFIWKSSSGNSVVKNEIIGHIHSPIDDIHTPILSPKNGYIIGHNNTPLVNIGDALFHIAY